MTIYTRDGYDKLQQAIVDQGGQVPCQSWPELFFPEMGGTSEPAKKLCQGCPVKLECLEYALNANETIGVWGGLSVLERKRLKRARLSRR